jgi:hypothetical protein
MGMRLYRLPFPLRLFTYPDRAEDPEVKDRIFGGVVNDDRDLQRGKSTRS